MDWLKNITATHLKAGYQAEIIAKKYLQKQRLKHQQSNYRCRYGEIDLIMWQGNTLVFVEVRYRKSNQYSLAQETVTAHKQMKVYRAAQCYLLEKQWTDRHPCRFDIIAIHGTIANHKIDWLKNAFSV